jgi:hypothetical protein
MKSGRRPKLDAAAIRLIDARRAACKSRIWHIKVIAWRLRVSHNTVSDAAYRKRAYSEVPRG